MNPALSEPPKHLFGKLPKWILTMGKLKLLSRSELRVFFALAIYADNNTGNSQRTWETIHEDTGVTLTEIGRITTRLDNFGLIRKWRKWSRVGYCINAEPPEWVRETANWKVEPDKTPKGSESYSKDPSTGKFAPRVSEARTSEILGTGNPSDSESA